MKFESIGREEASRIADGEFNHPLRIDANFLTEYGASVEVVASELRSLGSVLIDGESTSQDFLLSKQDAVTRSIFVVSFNPDVFGPNLIQLLVRALEKIRKDYLVAVDGSFSHGDSFYLFIEKKRLRYWFKNRERSSVFGLK